jgi:hypothetical protein
MPIAVVSPQHNLLNTTHIPVLASDTWLAGAYIQLNKISRPRALHWPVQAYATAQITLSPGRNIPVHMDLNLQHTGP